jgi:hypothetical protein
MRCCVELCAVRGTVPAGRLSRVAGRNSVKAPTEDELAGAKVYVQREGVQVPVDAEWWVLVDGRVLTRYPSGGWETSMFSDEALTAADGDWVEKSETISAGGEG